MTVCVSVKVSEGLVLAADSMSAVHGTYPGADGKTTAGILKTYQHVRKLAHLKDYPIGTLTWGTAVVGPRSIDSLIREYEYGLVSRAEQAARLKTPGAGDPAAPDEQPTDSVRAIAEGLLRHVQPLYRAAFDDEPPDQRPPLGILVGGFSGGQFFPEQWLIDLPRSADLQPIRPDVNGQPWFGAMWFGLTDAIVRLHWGRDERAIPLLAKRFNVSTEEIAALLEPLQYPVAFTGMPLQDAIDYAVYLVNVVIGRFRFVVGVPLCGGDIDVAVITPGAFHWVQRKSWHITDAPR
jgi:hypothetical protein